MPTSEEFQGIFKIQGFPSAGTNLLLLYKCFEHSSFIVRRVASSSVSYFQLGYDKGFKSLLRTRTKEPVKIPHNQKRWTTKDKQRSSQA